MQARTTMKMIEAVYVLLESYQALLWGIFQMGKILREKSTLSFTVTYQAMQDCNLQTQIPNKLLDESK